MKTKQVNYWIEEEQDRWLNNKVANEKNNGDSLANKSRIIREMIDREMKGRGKETTHRATN